ncbi:ferroxidase fet3 [Coemansia sp. RSA 1813]|nr:ferroxidase fet3 [Coemansia sp. RSA 1646]KAJ1773708.1 ferroxidase fet3 [Coemansia sp. RSA 1843]KAJ2093669.1 ferroxidase fet3 [Coemansia sp. RSA 986]KAJ2217881.1 ferroxidase fet3 [Coemansia sp. RSA 487]KAJ2573280.1 ferroxidase fet3 [Coemansia sp. RSA 1813]
MLSLHVQIALLAILGVCLAARVEVSWDIGYLTVNRDGHYTKRAVGVNGKLPIPPVHINRGDTLALHVHNSLNVPTTVHAHGLFHNGTAYNDGAGMVTQCGIPPGTDYTYEITPEQEGTYWLHGHYGGQNVDGLRTPFIIHEREPIADYEDEYLFSLEDSYELNFQDQLDSVLAPHTKFPPKSSFPFALINGYNGNDTKPITFKPGKKYRIRVINIGTTEWFKFSMPGHKMQIIEVEGVRSVPHPVELLNMGPGQRYSVLVEAKDTDQFNYVYNATLYADFVPFINNLNPRQYLGTIEYKPGAPLATPAPTADSESDWFQDIEINAYDRMPLLNPVTKRIELHFENKRLNDGVVYSILDGVPYKTPKVPTLFSAITMGNLSTDATVYGTQARVHILDYMDIVEVELHNTGFLDHTFHLHGHTFQVVEYGPTGGGSPRGFTPTKLQKARGAPIRRDTLMIKANSYIKIRFIADNPGAWLFHCHIDVHFHRGLGITFVEAPLMLQKTTRIPTELSHMCLRQGIPASGNGIGKHGYDLSGMDPIPFCNDLPANQTFDGHPNCNVV